MSDIELLEGEVICPKCKGDGVDQKDKQYYCPKCSGAGKMDWVSNAVNPKKSDRSVLDSINMRRMLLHVQASVENVKHEINDDVTRANLTNAISDYLDSLKSSNALYDYNIICDESNFNNINININIQPARTVELVTIDIQIK